MDLGWEMAQVGGDAEGAVAVADPDHERHHEADDGAGDIPGPGGFKQTNERVHCIFVFGLSLNDREGLHRIFHQLDAGAQFLQYGLLSLQAGLRFLQLEVNQQRLAPALL